MQLALAEDEDLDEMSSMATGAIEGYAGGKKNKNNSNTLIREEDLVERIVRKLTSGIY